MYLFILLFIVYLIVTLTRSECMSAAGLRFGWGFFFSPDLCESLQNGCVYLSRESVSALNTCVSEMRLIKFDELKKKKCLNALSRLCVVPLVSTRSQTLFLRTPTAAGKINRPVFSSFLLPFLPPPPPPVICSHTPVALVNCVVSQKS